MQTQCSADLFGFAPVDRRPVQAAFDGGAITSDAGGLLLGATDRAIRLVERFATCFRDYRRPELVEHSVETLVGQRIFGIVLGYEDLNDHDVLRHDPVMALLATQRAVLAAVENLAGQVEAMQAKVDAMGAFAGGGGILRQARPDSRREILLVAAFYGRARKATAQFYPAMATHFEGVWPNAPILNEAERTPKSLCRFIRFQHGQPNLCGTSRSGPAFDRRVN